jgi:hypothetical protein
MSESGDATQSALEDAARMLGLLAEPERLRVAAAVVLGHDQITDIARVSGVDERAVGHALARLVAGGLMVRAGSGYRFATEELKIAAQAVARSRPAEDIEGPAEQARVLRAFIRGGRLTSIPTAQSKRLVVLDYLAQEFEPGRRYREAQVNEILAGYHADVAALRRYLVDDGFLDREAGIYWRSGGTFYPDRSSTSSSEFPPKKRGSAPSTTP